MSKNPFTLPPVTEQMCLIKGVRGSGKTVMMNNIAEKLESRKDWSVYKIISQDNILEALYSDLFYDSSLGLSKHYKKNVKITLNAAPLKIEGSAASDRSVPKPNLVESIRRILKEVDHKKRKILVCIDDVSDTEQMAAFFIALQLYIGDNLPLFFLGASACTGFKFCHA